MGTLTFLSPAYSLRDMEQILVVILGVIAAVSAAPAAHDGVTFHHLVAAPIFYSFQPRVTYDINSVPQVIAPPREPLPAAVEAVAEIAVKEVAPVETPVEDATVVKAAEEDPAEDVAVVEAAAEAPAEDVAVVEAADETPVYEAIADKNEAALISLLPQVTYDLKSVPQVMAPPRERFVISSLVVPNYQVVAHAPLLRAFF